MGRALGRAMLRRAEQFDVEAGGRFRLRNERTVILWSAVLGGVDDDEGAPIASFVIDLGQPTTDDATIRRMAWDPAACSILEVYSAVDVLRGGRTGPSPV